MQKQTSSKKSLAALALVTLALAGCSAQEQNSASQDSSGSSSSASTSESASQSSNSQQPLTITEAWSKAADGGMTAVFGKVSNTSDQKVTITGVTTTISDTAELHTTELDSSTGQSQMKKVDSLSIDPGQTLTLEPGKDHVMIMDLQCSLKAGANVSVTLTTDSGQESNFEAVARDYSAAQEEYDPAKQASATATPTTAVKGGKAQTTQADQSQSSAHSNHSSTEASLPECPQ